MTTKRNFLACGARDVVGSGVKRRCVFAAIALPLLAGCMAETSSDATGDNPSDQIGSVASTLSVSDFTKPIPGAEGLVPASGTRDLLIVCMDKLTQDPMPSLSDIQTMAGQVQAYFKENSVGRLTISNVMYRGCGGNTGSYKSSSVDPPVPQQWTEALNQAAASGFRFRTYDHNGDGNITGDELGIAVVRQTPKDWDYGTLRNASFQVAGVNMTANIADIYLSPGVGPLKYGIVSHELLHDYANTVALYGSLPWRPGTLSIMDNHTTGNHLDAIHKLKLGWTKPTVRTLGAQDFSLGVVESAGEVTILADQHGSREYFVIEARSKYVGQFDNNLAQGGVLVWRAVEDTNLAATYSPNGQIERWGWQLLTPAPIQPASLGGTSFELPWLEGTTGYQLSVLSQSGGTAKISIKKR